MKQPHDRNFELNLRLNYTLLRLFFQGDTSAAGAQHGDEHGLERRGPVWRARHDHTHAHGEAGLRNAKTLTMSLAICKTVHKAMDSARVVQEDMAEQVRTAMQQGTPDDWHRPMKASDGFSQERAPLPRPVAPATGRRIALACRGRCASCSGSARVRQHRGAYFCAAPSWKFLCSPPFLRESHERKMNAAQRVARNPEGFEKPDLACLQK